MNHTSSPGTLAPFMSSWQEIPLNNITDCSKSGAIINHLIELVAVDSERRVIKPSNWNDEVD